MELSLRSRSITSLYNLYISLKKEFLSLLVTSWETIHLFFVLAHFELRINTLMKITETVFR